MKDMFAIKKIKLSGKSKDELIQELLMEDTKSHKKEMQRESKKCLWAQQEIQEQLWYLKLSQYIWKVQYN